MAKGKRIKTYTIIKQIEETNMAVIYKVKNRKGVYQALKLAKKDIKDHNDLIKREFQVLRQFSHPNIVKVMDLDTNTDGRAFFLQPFLTGKSINRIFNEFNTDFVDALLQTTNALAALHNKNYIHGDLKPGHLLYDKKAKTIILIDFGYTRVPDDITIRTGTFGYIAPEVLKGTSFDQRSDIYSLGVIMYELLKGKLPDMTWQDINTIPPEINKLLCRMCSHQPAFRPSIPGTFH